MSKFLKLVSNYNSLLSEEEQISDIESNIGTNAQQPSVMSGEDEQKLGDLTSKTDAIGDQDLIDLSKILSQFLNDDKFKKNNKTELLRILSDAQSNPEKVKTFISDFVTTWKAQPSEVVAGDSTN